MIDLRMNDSEKMDYHEDTMLKEKVRYPYGLRITLDSDTLKKLGITEPPRVGSKKMMLAAVECVEVSKCLNDEGQISVSLQITNMDLKGKDDGKKADSGSIESMLYGG